MKIKNFILLLSCLFLLKEPLQAEADKTQKIEVKFPLSHHKHTWKKNFHEEDLFISVTEYGLEGESDKNWSELITVHCFSAKCDFSLQDFFESAVSEVTKNHPYNKVKAHIGNYLNDTLLADWWIKDQSVNDQHEWVKIVKKENQVAVLRYTTKRIQQEAISAKFWDNLLKETTFE